MTLAAIVAGTRFIDRMMCCRGLALAVFISGIVSGINAAADQGKFLSVSEYSYLKEYHIIVNLKY